MINFVMHVVIAITVRFMSMRVLPVYARRQELGGYKVRDLPLRHLDLNYL